MEEWEEPLHPGSLRRTYPTSSHNATLFAHLLPLSRSYLRRPGKSPANSALPRDRRASVVCCDGANRRAGSRAGRSRADRRPAPVSARGCTIASRRPAPYERTLLALDLDPAPQISRGEGLARDRLRAGAGESRRRAGWLRLQQVERHRRRPRRGGAGRGGRVRGRDRAPERRAEDRRRGRRALAHPPARPLPATDRAAADPGLTAIGLRARHRSLARRTRRRLSVLAGLVELTADAARRRSAARLDGKPVSVR